MRNHSFLEKYEWIYLKNNVAKSGMRGEISLVIMFLRAQFLSVLLSQVIENESAVWTQCSFLSHKE